MALLEVTDLTIQYQTSEGPIQAVTDASFTLEEDDFVGLVGESGSGKTTIAESLIGMLADNGKIVEGEILYKGEPIQHYTESEFRENIRWKEISLIPQASMNSLDPIERIDNQALVLANTHTDWSEKRILDRLQELFTIVGIPAERISDYPFQFSGGMQQRVVIALGLLLEPSIVIADEPTTALDVIMQDQIFKHISNIRESDGVSMLLITHDVSVVFENCNRVVIVHGGHIAEKGDVKNVFSEPSHPYSVLLQQAFPDIRYPDRELTIIEGKPPQFFNNVDKCTFVERCPWAIEACTDELPPLQATDSDGRHHSSCIRVDEMNELVQRSSHTPAGVDQS